MESLAGHFLIASPAILDPNFHRVVVFVTAHSEEGAVGLILNRRSDATVGDAVPQLAPVTDLTDPVYVGGPVNPEGVAVLAEFHDPDEAGVAVLDDIFTEDPDGLWSAVLRRKGGEYELVARMPVDPSLN